MNLHPLNIYSKDGDFFALYQVSNDKKV